VKGEVYKTANSQRISKAGCVEIRTPRLNGEVRGAIPSIDLTKQLAAIAGKNAFGVIIHATSVHIPIKG